MAGKCVDKGSELDGFPDRCGDAFMDAVSWWREAGNRLLPGERGGSGGFTLFQVCIGDGCNYLGHTDSSVFECVDDLVASPFDERRSVFVSDHCSRMGSVVMVVASNLDAVAAGELRDELVRTAPEGMQNVGGSGLEARECFLAEVPAEPVRLTFAEWMKTREEPEPKEES